MKTLAFDLDDTLYPEIDFVAGGFTRVSEWIAESFKLDGQLIQAGMWATLKAEGRFQIFDKTLHANGIFSTKALRTCISLYRTHDPKISLSNSVLETLEWAQSKFPLFLVTDGNKLVQAQKIKALDIERFLKGVFVTHRYGLSSAKPSLRCFKIILETTKCDWGDLMYVGDNPIKDFVSLNAQGAETTGVESSPYQNPRLPSIYQPKHSIGHFEELPQVLDKLGWV